MRIITDLTRRFKTHFSKLGPVPDGVNYVRINTYGESIFKRVANGWHRMHHDGHLAYSVARVDTWHSQGRVESVSHWEFQAVHDRVGQAYEDGKRAAFNGEEGKPAFDTQAELWAFSHGFSNMTTEMLAAVEEGISSIKAMASDTDEWEGDSSHAHEWN